MRVILEECPIEWKLGDEFDANCERGQDDDDGGPDATVPNKVMPRLE